MGISMQKHEHNRFFLSILVEIAFFSISLYPIEMEYGTNVLESLYCFQCINLQDSLLPHSVVRYVEYSYNNIGFPFEFHSELFILLELELDLRPIHSIFSRFPSQIIALPLFLIFLHLAALQFCANAFCCGRKLWELFFLHSTLVSARELPLKSTS